MKLARRAHKRLPLTTRQGLLLLFALGVFFALVFAFVYSLPTWSQ